jgi:hypothetical protein
VPVWYGFCLALLALESFLHRRQAALDPPADGDADLGGSGVIYHRHDCALNNPIASLNTAAPAAAWKHDHRKWDSLHRVRILLLAVAVFVLTYALAVWEPIAIATRLKKNGLLR